MERVFNDIPARIALEIKELDGRVDEDYGQLEDEEINYPLVFPLVLISSPEINWGSMVSQRPFPQRGDGYITVRLAMHCYDDTHYNSPTATKIAERLKFVKALNKVLHGFTPKGTKMPLSRTSSKCYSIGGGVKVYEAVYAFSLIDEG